MITVLYIHHKKEIQILSVDIDAKVFFPFNYIMHCIFNLYLPPPHLRHLAKSLPVPRGRIATGGCLIRFAFSVNKEGKNHN